MRKRERTVQENYTCDRAEPDGHSFVPCTRDSNRFNTFNFSQNEPFLSYDIRTLWSYQLNGFVNYNRTFDKHGISAMLVYEQAETGEYRAYTRAEDPITNIDQDFAYSTDSERR